MDTNFELLMIELDNLNVFASADEYQKILDRLPPKSDLACDLRATIDARRGVCKSNEQRYCDMWNMTVDALGLKHRRH